MKQVYILIILFISVAAFPQAEEVKNYTWDTIPVFREIKQEFRSYPAVVLKDYRLYENRIGQYQYKAFTVHHCAIKIQSETAINDYNKISINKDYVRDYRDIQARVIKENGDIQILAKERIIEKDDGRNRQFVFEGVVKNDIIEYFYVVKESPEISGVEYFQRSIPVLEAKFQLNGHVAAGTYVYGYNGMIDKSNSKQRIFVATDLPAFKIEHAAKNLANLAKVYYFLHPIGDYDYLTFYRSLNAFADGKSAKTMIKRFVDELQLADSTVSLDNRLKKMDIYIKENLKLGTQPNYKDILDSKKISETMVLYLYKDVLDYLKVPYKFVATTNKFDDHFDRQYAIPLALTEIMIFIRETEKFLLPFNYWMPYGPPSSVALHNEGVFFTVNKRDVYRDNEIIGGVSIDENISMSTSEISVEDDMETVTVMKNAEYTGYRSYYFRYLLQQMQDDKISDFVKNVLFEDVDLELTKKSFYNIEYRHNYDPKMPFRFETTAKINENWIESAGDNKLITLGKVLGKQENLYQVTERDQPINIAYPQKSEHTIIFNVPAGYEVRTVTNLQFGKEISMDDEVIAKFSSDARIEGRKVIIDVMEFYDFTELGKDRYNDYRDVINAAYDFYKSTLVLVKV